MKKFIYTISVLFATHIAFAQTKVPCSADYEFNKLKEQNPEVAKQWAQYNQAFLDYVKTVDLAQFKPNATNAANKPIAGKTGTSRYIIPVVFHVLHNNNAYGENVTDAQAVQEIANMNANYNASNMYRDRIRAIFKDVEGNAQITFRLAKIKITYDSITGNMIQTPTTGIEHIYVGPLTAKADDFLKGNTSWDPSRYLNIWVCSFLTSYGGAFQAGGHSNYPTTISTYKYDGPLISAANGFGINPVNASGNPFSLVTASHEVGHYLGLIHPFDGSSPTDSCGEDYCYDTPPTYFQPYGGADHTRDFVTCATDFYSASTTCMSPYLPDQVENFMDYYILRCSSIMFTLQQVARMHFTLENYRRTLWQPENLIATGVDDTINAPKTVPIAAFSIFPNNNLTDVRACAGQAISFKDNSYNGTITKWEWDFGDGFTSTLQNPAAVTYATPGYKTVSLTVTGANGSNTKTISNYIYIEGIANLIKDRAATADWDWANTYLQDGWHYENEYPYNPWIRTTRTFYDGNASLEVSSNGAVKGFNNSLISPPLNFTGAPKPYMEFYYSFATNYDQANGNKSTQDALSVHTSVDCGKTWSAARILIGGRSYYSNAIPMQNGSVVDPNPLCTTPVSGSSTPTPVLASLDFRPTGPSQWKVVSVTNIPTQANVKLKIMLSCGGGNNLYIDNLRMGFATGINEISASDMHIGVFPNPFSENTILTYSMPSKAKVDVKIYDIIGKEIGTVYSGTQEIGTQQIVIEKSKFNLNTGLYFIKMTLDGTKEFTHKIVVN